jgi:hypothetical protein
MTQIITQKSPSTNDNNIEMGRRRYKLILKIIGLVLITLPVFSSKIINDFIAPFIINLSFSEYIFRFLINMEITIGPVAWFILLAGMVLIGVSWCVGFSEKRSAQRRINSIESMSDLEALNWRQFEEILADYYLLRGYRVTLAGGSGGGGDGGIDLIIRKGFKKIIVQAKHYKSNVGVGTIREMYGVMHHFKANGVIVCNCSGFSADAQEFVKKKPIYLVHGPKLLGMFVSISSSQKKNK